MQTTNANRMLGLPDEPMLVVTPLTAGFSPSARFLGLCLASLLFNITLLFICPPKYAIVSLIVSIAMAGVATIPLENSLQLILFYFTFEGMVKLLTNYHPVLHVSGDILLLILAFRSLLDKSTGGVNKMAQTPYMPLLLLFSFWVFVQFFNPYSLGILPSIAGLKIYLVPFIVLFLAYHHVRREQIIEISHFIVLIACFISTVSVIEYIWGQQFMISLSAAYKMATREIFVNSLYRPFGTTSIPGKPATWVCLAAPFATYLLFQSRVRLHLFQKLTCIYYVLICGPLLLICQTRISLLQTVVSAVIVLSFNKKSFVPRLGIAILFIFLVVSPLLLRATRTLTLSSSLSTAQLKVLEKRVTSLTQKESYTESRANPLPRIWRDLNKFYILGLGLSRVGAAAGPWQERITNHPYFRDDQVGWADNLFVALFHELGIQGLLAYLYIYFKMMTTLYRHARSSAYEYDRNCDYFFVWACFATAVVTLISGYAAEGALYSPVSIFLWMSFGLGLREVANAKQ